MDFFFFTMKPKTKNTRMMAKKNKLKLVIPYNEVNRMGALNL